MGFTLSVDELNSFLKECDLKEYEAYTDEYVGGTLIFLSKKDSVNIYCDEGQLHFFAFCSDRLIGFASVFEADYSFEISVVTHPDFRRHAVARNLVNLVLSKLSENYDLDQEDIDIFLTGSNEGFANSLGFEFSHSEHFMRRDPLVNSKSTPKNANEASTEVSYKITIHKDYSEIRLYNNEKSIASLRLTETEGFINIWKVYTNKAYRGQGYATLLVNYALSLSSNKPYLLQVSGQNIPAIRAYSKAGFKFIHTTEYYKLI